MRGNIAYWIGGTLTALFGVALVRLLAPALVGSASSFTAVVGHLLVIVGITVIARATIRPGSQALLTIEQEAED
jgi:hypothetical protein